MEYNKNEKKELLFPPMWISYDVLKDRSIVKKKQVDSLFYSSFEYDDFGQAACYIPFPKFKEINKRCLELYDAITTVDHDIAICDEIYHTMRIEGSHTTRKRTTAIHNGEKIDPSNFKSEKMTENGFKATKYLNTIGNSIDEEKLRTFWEIVTEDVCDNEDIKGNLYRIGTVGVGKIEGLEPSQINIAMKHWLDFYHSTKEDELIFLKAALLHYTFERIHPFCDGNGRTGRLLMSNFLIMKGYDKIKAISFSKDIGENVSDYYNSLDLSGNYYFDCTPFLEFMMESMNRSLCYAYLQNRLGSLMTGISASQIKDLETKEDCDKFIHILNLDTDDWER